LSSPTRRADGATIAKHGASSSAKLATTTGGASTPSLSTPPHGSRATYFHALAYERELARAGVEVFYAVAAGDQTSPEGRLVRHIFQALDQFEVEGLSRETRRGQIENARQGYRNGGRAPYGCRLEHQPHPDPRRASAGDSKSRLVPDPDQAAVIVEIFDHYLAGSGFKEIADHLNRPGGPTPPLRGSKMRVR